MSAGVIIATQMTIQVRHAEPRDAPDWIAMRVVLWPDDTDTAHAAEVARFFARAAGASAALLPEAALVATVHEGEAEVLVGFAELNRRPYAEGCVTSPVGFLEGWYVRPEYRRRGVGRALVLAAEGWARDLGCSEFGSDTQLENTGSAAAHRALGFEEVEVIRCFRKDLR